MYHISCLWIQNVNLMIFEPFKYYFSLETWFSIMLENAPKCHKIAHCKKLVFEAFFFFLKLWVNLDTNRKEVDIKLATKNFRGYEE